MKILFEVKAALSVVSVESVRSVWSVGQFGQLRQIKKIIDFMSSPRFFVMHQMTQDEKNADYTCDFRLEAVFLCK